MVEVGFNVELVVRDIGNNTGGGDGGGVESGPLGLGLLNELLLLLELGISHLLLSLGVEGSVVNEAVDDTGTEGGPSQNVESGRHLFGCVMYEVLDLQYVWWWCVPTAEVKYDNAPLANGSTNISRVTNSIDPRVVIKQGGWLSS